MLPRSIYKSPDTSPTHVPDWEGTQGKPRPDDPGPVRVPKVRAHTFRIPPLVPVDQGGWVGSSGPPVPETLLGAPPSSEEGSEEARGRT